VSQEGAIPSLIAIVPQNAIKFLLGPMAVKVGGECPTLKLKTGQGIHLNFRKFRRNPRNQDQP